MAKKQKTEGVLAKQSRLEAEAVVAQQAAEDVATRAAEQEAARAAEQAAVEKRRADKAAARKKPKSDRFVREKKEKQPRATAVPLPPRSTTAAGKMMSKNVTVRPKKDSGNGPKPKPEKPTNEKL